MDVSGRTCLLRPKDSRDAQSELAVLSAAKPAQFEHRDLTDFIRDAAASERNADILFLAAQLCQNDLDELCRKFSGLCTIYSPYFIGDMDADRNTEIVVGGFTPLRFDRMTEIVIFEQEPEKIVSYSYLIPRLGMNISVHTRSDGKPYILAKGLRERNIEISGTNRLATIEYEEYTVLRFTGAAIEVVEPLTIGNEKLILDEEK